MSKSAAQFKPVAKSGAAKHAARKQLEEMPTIEETWENAHNAFISTAEVAHDISKRIDNFMNVRDLAYKFWGAERMAEMKPAARMTYLHKLHGVSVDTYGKIVEVVKTFEMEEFLKDEMRDYFGDIIPKVEDIEDEDALMEASIIFLTVKPWGEKMTALHRTMLDEKGKREFLEA